jgi:hypothetical protein
MHSMRARVRAPCHLAIIPGIVTMYLPKETAGSVRILSGNHTCPSQPPWRRHLAIAPSTVTMYLPKKNTGSVCILSVNLPCTHTFPQTAV